MSWTRGLGLAGLVLGVLGLLGCGRYEEIFRLPSPDGRVDAVVVEVEAGGGNPFVYRLYLVGRGEAWRKGQVRLTYTAPVRFRVTWADARHLELCYDEANIDPGGTPVAPNAGQRPQDLVEIKLVKPVTDCTAPPPS
jgi:hypothetical protein